MEKQPADQNASSDDRFEVVANASVDGLLVIDGDGIVQYANAAAITMFSEQAENLVGFHFGTPAVREASELQLPSKGEIRYVEMRTSEFCWEGREATLANLRDITERKQAEEGLRKSKHELERTLEATTDGIWTWNFKTDSLFFSSKYYKMLGYEPNEFPANFENWLKLIHPDDLEQALSYAEEYLKTKPDEYKNEFRVRTKSNDYRWMHAHARVVEKDENGEAVYLIGNHQDITERKRAEAAKAEQQALLEAIYRNAPLIMMVVNEERRIQQVNGFASQFADRSTEEMLGLRGGEALRCMHALDDPQGCGFGEFCQQCTIRNSVLDTLANGTTHLQVEADYYPEPSEDRTRTMKLLLSSTPLVLNGKRMALVTMLDITERTMLEHELWQAQKMESVGRLAGGVAHDFNNLLMGIMGYADICREELDEHHSARKWLDDITSAVERSANLTRQLLTFARKETVAPRVLNLNDAVEDMLKMLRRLIGEDIDLAWEPGAKLGTVKIDPSQVDQILANLCVNARDAIGGVGKVSIETENVSIDADYVAEDIEANCGDYVMLAVSDNGCGMDHETLKNVFEPFYTTKSAGEGTGLGLATIYGIVKQNEGFVNVYSEPGKGTTFRIYLPRFEDTQTDAEVSATEPEIQGGEETILLVEDEKPIRDIIGICLHNLGYTVLQGEEPEHALRLVAEHSGSIDLLLTDVVMPSMNGRDLAERLAPDYPSMKVLYMSGYTANVIAQHGILDEGVEFLSKPIGRNKLAAKVREVLDR